MNPHDQLELLRELLALERAVASAPDSKRVRDAYNAAWSYARQQLTNDQFESLSDQVANALDNMPCQQCGGIGFVADHQYHAGAFEPEPIVSPCEACCNRCRGDGLRIDNVDVYTPQFDADGDVVGSTQTTQTIYVYCECIYGNQRRRRDESLSMR